MIVFSVIFLFWFIFGLIVGVHHSRTIPMDTVFQTCLWGILWPVFFVLELPWQ